MERKLTELEDLDGVYAPVSVLSTHKVLQHFDVHTTGFLESATFMVANVRDRDGNQVAIVSGGPTGFARVLDPTTMEMDLVSDDWPEDRLPLLSGYEAGLLVAIPSVTETMRLKGEMRVVPTADPSVLRATLKLHNTFFHCGKAFIRGRLWEDPAARAVWKGLRAFRCVEKVKESSVITSFHLAPEDGGDLPGFFPGQHVAVEIAGGVGEPLRRVYSLSGRPGTGTWRITVKREPHSSGGSAYLHDVLEVGETIQLRTPAGSFKLNAHSSRPVVLMSAGVGITPMLSMLEHMIQTKAERPIWFFHGARSGHEQAMRRQLRELEEAHDNLRVVVAYSRPGADDVEGQHFDIRGRLSLDILKDYLPWDDYEFYLCGPTAFLKTTVAGLLSRGIRSDRIRWEVFSGDGSEIVGVDQPKTPISSDAGVSHATIQFLRSNKIVSWEPKYKSILELAEANGVATRSSCCSGICFSCAAKVVSGDVRYAEPLEDAPDDGTALLCCALPAGDVVIDL